MHNDPRGDTHGNLNIPHKNDNKKKGEEPQNQEGMSSGKETQKEKESTRRRNL